MYFMTSSHSECIATPNTRFDMYEICMDIICNMCNDC